MSSPTPPLPTPPPTLSLCIPPPLLVKLQSFTTPTLNSEPRLLEHDVTGLAKAKSLLQRLVVVCVCVCVCVLTCFVSPLVNKRKT